MARGSFITQAERNAIWEWWGQGWSAYRIAESLGRARSGIQYVLGQAGGVRPRERTRHRQHLTLAEREEISRGIGAGLSLRAIAERLGRPPSTVCREVKRNGGREGYRAWAAEVRAGECARRPKPRKLEAETDLAALVEAGLEERWSPEQIAGVLRFEHPDDPEKWVSHETIYKALFVQGKGTLRKELTACLRSGRAIRRPKRKLGERRGRIKDMVMISERPAEVEDRAVPGHWEGDLLIGKDGKSAIVTLVERSTRFTMLGAIGRDRTAPAVRDVLTELIQRVPSELAKSLTWDQGREMAQHRLFTVDTGVEVFFCDPHSPWQRGTNENTNGLLRQYFPKGTSLARVTQDELDAVARQLNGRPRETLGFRKPKDVLAALVASTP